MSCPRALSIKQAIMEAITAAGPIGRTVPELVATLACPHQTVSARLSELKKEERVKDSGRSRPSPFSVQATVWVTPESLGQDPRYHELVTKLAPLPQLARTILGLGPEGDTTVTLMAANGPSHSITTQLPPDLIRLLATL